MPTGKSRHNPAEYDSGIDLDPRLLLTFREVAKLGSISAAARKLGWTQPALGQQLRRLEREAGTALVSRHARGITLTPAGELLLRHAEAIANRLIVAQTALRSSTRRRATRLQVASFATATAGLLTPAVGRLVAEDPNLAVGILEMPPPQAVEALGEGQVDAALVFESQDGFGETGEARQLERLEIGRDPLLVLMPAGHRLCKELADDEPLPMRALSRERWVAGCLRSREHLAACGAANGFRPDIRYLTGDQLALQQIVAVGLGVAMVSHLSLRTYHREDVVARRLVGDPYETIRLLTRQADPRTGLSMLATQLRVAAREAFR